MSDPTERPVAGPAVLLGLGLCTLGMLAFELMLTRVYSATMGYHLAFVAISVALFGTAAAAVIIDLKPAWFPIAKTHARMAQAAIAFAVAATLALRLGPLVPAEVRMSMFARPLVVLYALSAVPMLCAGFVVCLALARHRNIGVVYAADLGGAAVGCILFVALAGVAELPALAALAGAWLLVGRGNVRRAAIVAGLFVLLFGSIGQSTGLLRLRFRMPGTDLFVDPIYDRMNAFSRVVVVHNPDRKPFGWGMSDNMPPVEVVQRSVFIDSTAGTVLTEWTGDDKQLEHLRWDITNLVHYAKGAGSRVYIMGVGGGRDLLSALLFGAKRVVAAEINPTIVHMLREAFYEFTGHLASDPRLSLNIDDARSRMERTGESFDVIMASLTDTWAATSSGAYTLTENPLYTREGWRTFLGHLAPGGMLSFSRWWTAEAPAEDLRLITLARAALADVGISDPKGRVALVGVKPKNWGPVCTVLVKRDPFTPEELARMDEVIKREAFVWLVDPRGPGVDPYREALVTPDPRGFLEKYPLDVRPPTDDRPFYFLFTKVRDFWKVIGTKPGEDVARLGDGPLPILFTLSIVTIFLAGAFVLGPMWWRRVRDRRGGERRPTATGWDVALFVAIGLGFLLVEIAQIQRLSLLLGHPSYSLASVLATLLLAAGAGSLVSERLPGPEAPARMQRLLATILGTLLVVGLVTPAVIRFGVRLELPWRVVLAVLVVAPIGLCLGTVLPLGVRTISLRAPGEVPWLWAVNGAVSVFASVLATMLSIAMGIGATYMVGAACYALASYALMRMGRAAPAS